MTVDSDAPSISDLDGIWTLDIKNHAQKPAVQKCVVVHDGLLMGGDDAYQWVGSLKQHRQSYKSGNGKATLYRNVVAVDLIVSAYAKTHHHWVGEMYPKNLFGVDDSTLYIRCKGEYYPRNNTIELLGRVLNSDDSCSVMVEGKHLRRLDMDEINALLSADEFGRGE